METLIFKSLQVGGVNLIYTASEGKYWLAIKPISVYFEIDYSNVFRRLTDNPLFKNCIKIFKVNQQGTQRRNMAFLPENIIYVWIYGLRSSINPLLIKQVELCDLIYTHFHSATIRRIDSIKEKAITRKNRNIIERTLRIETSEFNELEQLQAKEARIGKTLRDIENDEITEQLKLFS